MQAYSVEKVIGQDGKVQLDSLPFMAGETVQIIILSSKRPVEHHESPLLKGSVIEYINPLEPVASDDWSILQ